MTQTPWWLAILIGLFSGGLGAALTYSLNYRKERAQFLRQKAEELYLSLDHYSRWVSYRYISIKIVEKGGVMRAELPSEELEASKSYRSSFSICEVYFPHIMPIMNEILDARDGLDGIIDCYNYDKIDKLDSAAQKFEQLCIKAKRKVADQCRNPLRHITYVRLLYSPWN